MNTKLEQEAKEYKEWCSKNNLTPCVYKNLKRFIDETKKGSDK